MNHYQQLSQKALGVAFIMAPLLLVTGAFTLVLGIGLSSYGVSSWVEGLFLTFAFLLFVPVYLGLSNILGQRAPRLGIICAILSLGIGFGMLPANARITTEGLERAGYQIAIFSLNSPGVPLIFIYLALAMLVAPILLAIGFWRYGGISRWSATLLILAPIIFVMGQGGDETIAAWQVKVMYPLATVIWLLALVPIGVKLIGNSSFASQTTPSKVAKSHPYQLLMLILPLSLLFLVGCGQSTEPTTAEVSEEAAMVVESEAAVSEESAEPEAEAAGPIKIDTEGAVPFYARFGENEIFDDGEWAVIVFYRPPSCIPADFNLSRFFDFPSETDPGAFGCAPATMDSVEVWENSPETDPAPLEVELTGRGEVPVWFVEAAELEAEVGDGIITIEELAALPSRLVGTATSYSEFLRPTQSNDAPLIQFTAAGTLEDGTPFEVDVSKGHAETTDHVTIDLR